MNDDKSTTELVPRVCPICQAKYQTSNERPAPTCGHPNCIREARDRGLPFVASPVFSGEKPLIPRKRTKGKAQRRRS